MADVKWLKEKLAEADKCTTLLGSHQPCFTKWKTDAGFSLHEFSFLVDLVFHCALSTRESFGVNIDKEGWAPRNWYFWTLVLLKTLESPLDFKEIQLVHPKGNKSWIFIGRTDAEAEAPILWPPDAKNWLIWKDSDAGKDWRQKEKGTTVDEMGWMASLTQWTWVWASSERWWRTGKPGVLQSTEARRVRHDWTTKW